MIYLLLVAVVCLAIAGFKITLMREEIDSAKNVSKCFEESYRDEQKKVNYLRAQRDESDAKIERLCGQLNKLQAPKKKPAKKRSS